MAASMLYTLMRPTSGERTSIFPAGVCAVNSRPLKAQREFLRRQVARSLQAVGQRAPRQALKPRAYGSSALITATSGAPAPVPSNKRRFAAKYSSKVLW